MVPLVRQALNSGTGGFQTGFQRLAPTKRGRPRARSDPHPILGYPLQGDRSGGQQTADDLGQEIIERLSVGHAKNRRAWGN